MRPFNLLADILTIEQPIYYELQDAIYERVKSSLCLGLQRAPRTYSISDTLWDAFLHLFALLTMLTTYVRETGDGR